MSLLILRILRISKHSQKFKLAHDFYLYCFARSYCVVVARAAFAMSKSILACFFEACRKSWRARSQAT